MIIAGRRRLALGGRDGRLPVDIAAAPSAGVNRSAKMISGDHGLAARRL